jgi:hypothetical protein
MILPIALSCSQPGRLALPQIQDLGDARHDEKKDGPHRLCIYHPSVARIGSVEGAYLPAVPPSAGIVAELESSPLRQSREQQGQAQ